MGFESARNLYFSESYEMLAEMEKHLLALEDNPEDSESINALFRAVHTIKGSSGMFGVNDVMNFAHAAENVMDKIRQGKMPLDEKACELLLKAHDTIKRMLEYFEKGGDSLPEDIGRAATSIKEDFAALDSSAAQPSMPSGVVEARTEVAAAEPPVDDGVHTVKNKFWHISIHPKREIFSHGYDPYSFIRFLTNKGEIINVKTILEEIPEIDLLNPEQCYLGFEIVFDSKCDKTEIASVFEFISDDCVINILPPYSRISEYTDLIKNMSFEPMKIGDILVAIGALSKSELAEALESQEKTKPEDSPKKIGQIAEEKQMIHAEVVKAAVEKQKISGSDESRKKSIRVDADRLDSLINLVGELVITGAAVAQKSSDKKILDLNETVSQMNRLIDEVRNSALNLRMVQIGETFSRFKRIVRDLSRELGKDVELVIEGGDTELDKTIVEKISDPIMHLVRNSIDHGISTPGERTAAGKNPQGTITLNAYHETGSIVIVVNDDGEGLRKEKILSKAIERGLVRPDQTVSERDVFNLIFEPGFSTAETVTSVSGRGVGMDVVKRNIVSLRGTVNIESDPGRGTSVKIQLPLTLSIIDGFRVDIGGKSYVLPLDLVIECIEVSGREIGSKDGGNFLNLRGEILPFIKMRDFFGVSESEKDLQNVVVVEYAGHKAGLVVDNLLGEFQTVIKPLGRIYKNISWLSGATILGTGEISLILDVPQLIQHVSRESVG